jgi:hypothetical protein
MRPKACLGAVNRWADRPENTTGSQRNRRAIESFIVLLKLRLGVVCTHFGTFSKDENSYNSTMALHVQ